MTGIFTFNRTEVHHNDKNLSKESEIIRQMVDELQRHLRENKFNHQMLQRPMEQMRRLETQLLEGDQKIADHRQLIEERRERVEFLKRKHFRSKLVKYFGLTYLRLLLGILLLKICLYIVYIKYVYYLFKNLFSLFPPITYILSKHSNKPSCSLEASS